MAELTSTDATTPTTSACCSAGREPAAHDDLRETVRDRYAAAARAAADPDAGGCCGPGAAVITDDRAESFGGALYADAERRELPDTAVLASRGCGTDAKAVAARISAGMKHHIGALRRRKGKARRPAQPKGTESRPPANTFFPQPWMSSRSDVYILVES